MNVFFSAWKTVYAAVQLPLMCYEKSKTAPNFSEVKFHFSGFHAIRQL